VEKTTTWGGETHNDTKERKEGGEITMGKKSRTGNKDKSILFNIMKVFYLHQLGQNARRTECVSEGRKICIKKKNWGNQMKKKK